MPTRNRCRLRRSRLSADSETACRGGGTQSLYGIIVYQACHRGDQGIHANPLAVPGQGLSRGSMPNAQSTIPMIAAKCLSIEPGDVDGVELGRPPEVRRGHEQTRIGDASRHDMHPGLDGVATEGYARAGPSTGGM